MEKRGLSNVIVTLIIIVISLIAVGLVWVVVQNLIEGETDEISLGFVTVDLEIKDVKVKANETEVKVKRKIGEGELSGLKFIVSDGINTVIIDKENINLSQLEEKTFILTSVELGNIGFIKEISVAPIFKLGSGEEKIGNVADTYNIIKPGSAGGSNEPEIVLKGNRILALDINAAEGSDFGTAFNTALSVGIELDTVALAWDDLDDLNNGGPGLNFLAIANAFYPPSNTSLSISIATVDTGVNRMPDDIAHLPFNDTQVISEFKEIIDYVMSQVPDVEIHSISIGNEIDIGHSTSDPFWEEYSDFYRQSVEYGNTNYSNVKFGTKATFQSLVGSHKQVLQNLNQYSDVIMITYYPQDDNGLYSDPLTARNDFDELVGVSNKSILILEAGFPSSSVVGSSDEKQMQFIKEIFLAWDKHATQIELISFLRIHDFSVSLTDSIAAYYGLSGNEEFKEYLRTLGLRTVNGEDKLAFEVLRNETGKRGW